MCVPVAITTMYRYSHLRKCIDSLKKNNLAKETTIYISIDYPSEKYQKYMNGYLEIKKWLSNNEIIGFKKVNIYWQENNLGPYENSQFLTRMVENDGYEAIIKTEDDNVFSENFLEYMNKALCYSKNNPQISSVCGYLHDEKNIIPQIYEGYSAFGEMGYSEWGVGYLINRNNMIERDISFEYLYKIINDRKLRNKVINSSKNNYELLIMGYLGRFQHMLYKNGELAPIDQMKRLWNIVNDSKQILPVKNKVYNIGIDGSGLHVPKLADYKMNSLDDDNEFTFNYCDKVYLESKFRNRKMYKVTTIKYCGLRLLNIFICIFGKNITNHIIDIMVQIKALFIFGKEKKTFY